MSSEGIEDGEVERVVEEGPVFRGLEPCRFGVEAGEEGVPEVEEPRICTISKMQNFLLENQR